MITKLSTRSLAEQGVPDETHPHVLLVVDQFPEFLGGGERHVLELARLLPQYGYRVSILTFAVHPKSIVARESPCALYVLPIVRTYDWKALRAALSLRKFLRQQKVAIVQTHFESSDLWAGFVTRTMSKAALVWSRRDMGILRDGKHRKAYRWMRNLPNAVFAVSEQVRRYTIDVDGVPAERVKTIYNGMIPPAPMPRVTPADGCQRIGTVGNLRAVKGHDVLVRAVAQVAERFPSASLRIAGGVLEPEYGASLHALVESLGMQRVVRFDGPITQVEGYLRTLDIFVLPSRSEGFSNAILEAMAVSLPVVATDVGGNAEAVEDGVTGWIVPSDDVDRMAVALESLLADPLRAQAMGIAGRKRLEERFTTDAMMRRIDAEYRTLLSTRSGSAP